MIRFSHVVKEYPRTGLALQDVTFRVNKGEFAFLTGPSGAGKSTILRLVIVEETPTAGEVRVSGMLTTGTPRGGDPAAAAQASASSSRTFACSRIAPRRRTSRSRSR